MNTARVRPQARAEGAEAQGWDGLAPESIAALSASADMVQLKRGEATTARIGIVLSGALGLARELADGRRVLTALFHAEDFFDLRRGSRPQEGVPTALAETVLLAVEEERLAECLADRTDLAGALLAHLGAQIGRLQDHSADLACKTPMERMASALLEFRRWPGAARGAEGERLALPLRRTDIADYIGVKAETASRVFRQLEEEQLISPGRRNQIVVNDLPELKRIASGGRPRRSTRR